MNTVGGAFSVPVATLILTGTFWVAGCTTGDHDDHLPAVNLEEGGQEAEGASSSCTPGDEDDCSITLAQHNGVLSCYHGVKVCSPKGKWGACASGTVQSAPLPAGTSGKRLLALTTTSECEDDPCDPSCRLFPDLPDAATDDNIIVRTSPYDWESGSLSKYPKGLVDKGLKEPCTTGADCQFDTRCINPVTEACTHEKCSAGDALSADCDPCVEAICEDHPECCTGFTGGCSHDLGATGDALSASCDDCVADICTTSGFEYCCDTNTGSWDDACVAEVANTCGLGTGCCDGEVSYGGNCYYVENDAMNWWSARASCQARGTGWDLASVSDDAENDFLQSLDVDDENWIGITSGNGFSSGNDWVWTNGDPSGSWNANTRRGLYDAFTSGEPNYGEECTRMASDGSWKGRTCSVSYQSYCEGPPSCTGGSTSTEPPAACEHDPCQVGVALKDDCDSCVQAVCDADPTCCDDSEAWTSSCVALVASECTATCDCADGEDSYDGHCYFLDQANATWSTALTNCRDRGSDWDLVSIGSSGENDFVRQLNGSNDTWIGFTEYSTYGGSNNKWVWTNADPSGYWRENGHSSGVNYLKWYSGEPNGSGECARMKANSNGAWADYGCSSTFDYVCEAPSGNTLSEFVPVQSTPSNGGNAAPSYGTGGFEEDRGEWTDACVDLVASTCDATCGMPEDQGTGVCTPWYPGQTDPTCSGVDLAVGIPCDDNVPVCNHGTETAPAGVRIIHFPANSNQYPKCDPDQTHPQMYECFTQEEIPPGTCIDVTTCPHLVGNREIMVNPEGSDHVDECSCLDNWSLFSGGQCGAPVCSGGTNVATLKSRPIDIIVSVDNSGSMQGEIVAIQQRINDDFARILEDSAIDYRVILVSRYGNVYSENYNGGSAYDSAYSMCIGPPLSTLNCPSSAYGSTPAVAHNPPKFFHHSTDIGSHDMWCKLIDSFDTSDPYPAARTGFTSIAPDGWGPYLRDDAFKVFVGITDDSPATNSGGTQGNCVSSTGFTNDLSGAKAFDQALRTLSPTEFGAYDSTDPDQDRNYIWYSIVGMAGNAVSDPTPLEPTDAVENKCCRGDGTSTSNCPGIFAADPDGAGNGVGYQQLSKMTGGLRYPSCYNDNFDDVFNAIASEVVEGAQVSCDFTLQNAGNFDIDTAKVYFQKNANANPTELDRADSLADCGSKGWYLPDPNDTSSLSLCPSACKDAQKGTDSRLSVEVGCLGTGYEPYSFSETYGAECNFDEFPQWGFLSIDTSTPGDSSVVLRIRAADSEAELADAPYQDLATLSSANGNSTCTGPDVDGCPLDLYTALGGAPGAHYAFIELEVTVNPTSNGTALPTIDTWSISHSCVDSL